MSAKRDRFPRVAGRSTSTGGLGLIVYDGIMRHLDGAAITGGFGVPGADDVRLVGQRFFQAAGCALDHPDGGADYIAAHHADRPTYGLADGGAGMLRVTDGFTIGGGAARKDKRRAEQAAESDYPEQ